MLSKLAAKVVIQSRMETEVPIRELHGRCRHSIILVSIMRIYSKKRTSSVATRLAIVDRGYPVPDHAITSVKRFIISPCRFLLRSSVTYKVCELKYDHCVSRPINAVREASEQKRDGERNQIIKQASNGLALIS